MAELGYERTGWSNTRAVAVPLPGVKWHLQDMIEDGKGPGFIWPYLV